MFSIIIESTPDGLDYDFASTPVLLNDSLEDGKNLYAVLVEKKETIEKLIEDEMIYAASRKFMRELPKEKRGRLLRKIIENPDLKEDAPKFITVKDDGIFSDTKAFVPMAYMGRMDLSWQPVEVKNEAGEVIETTDGEYAEIDPMKVEVKNVDLF